MRKLYLVVFLIFVVLLTGCDSGNSDKKTDDVKKQNYIEIADGESGKVVTSFYLTKEKDSMDRLNLLTEAYNYKEPTEDELPETPSYIQHTVSVEDSHYDQWYKIYIKDNILYIQDWVEKEDYAESLGITDDICKCEKVTADDFMKVINDYKSDDITETIDMEIPLKTTTVSNATVYMDVFNYSDGKKIARIDADSSIRATTIMSIYNFNTLVDEELNLKDPDYEIKYINKKNKAKNVSFVVYLKDESVYISKMNKNGSEEENSYVFGGVYKADTVSADEFLEAVEG